ncbi:MAG: tetratricopeptide repeat protein, partial [Myxococcales bacterium]|nr:tetratricopeptide repeat protein [Myxococcales bacterium]
WDSRLAALLKWEQAEILRGPCDDIESAIAELTEHKEALNDAPFLNRAYERILVEEGRWTELISHLERLLEEGQDPDEAARIHLDLAGIYEFESSNGAKAFEQYQAALAADPENRSAMLGAVRVAERAGRLEAATLALQVASSVLPGEFGAALALRWAEIAEMVQDDPRLALSLYERLLDGPAAGAAEIGRDACWLAEERVEDYCRAHHIDEAQLARYSDSAVWLLAGSRPAEVPSQPHRAVQLGRVFRSLSGDPAHLTAALETLAQSCESAVLAADLRRFAALIMLDSAQAVPVDTWKQIAQIDPSDDLPLLILHGQAAPGSDIEGWAVEQRIKMAPAGVERADAIGSLIRHAQQKGDENALWDAVEKLRTDVPAMPIGGHFREALLDEQSQPELIADRLEQKAKSATSVTLRTELLLGAAEMRRQGNNDASALDTLGAVLEVDPTNVEAFEKMREALAAEGNWEALLDLFEVRLLALMESGTTAEQSNLLSQMAEIAEIQMADRTRAIELWEKALRWEPGQLDVGANLFRVLGQESRWLQAVQAAETVIANSPSGPGRQKLQLDVALVCVKHLDDVKRASFHYRAILQETPDHPVALKGLADVAETLGQTADAVWALEELLRLAPKDKRALPLQLRMIKVLGASTSESDLSKAKDLLRVALKAGLTDARVGRLLGELARTTRDFELVEETIKQLSSRIALDRRHRHEQDMLRQAFRTLDAAGLRERATSAASLLAVLSYATERSEARRLATPPPHDVWTRFSPLPGELTAAVFPHGLSHPLLRLLRAADPYAAALFPSRAKRLGAARRTRVKADGHPALAMASMLGRGNSEVYACLAPGMQPVTEPGAAPQLLIPMDWSMPTSSAQLWSVGYAVAPAAMGVAALSRLPAHEWMDAITALVRTLNPHFLSNDPNAIVAPEFQEQISAKVANPIQEAVEPLVQEVSLLNREALSLQYRLHKIAFGALALVGCPDISEGFSAALQATGDWTIVRGNAAFVLSKEFQDLRRAVGCSRGGS